MRRRWFKLRSRTIFEPFTIQGPEWLRDWGVMVIFVVAAYFILFVLPVK